MGTPVPSRPRYRVGATSRILATSWRSSTAISAPSASAARSTCLTLTSTPANSCNNPLLSSKRSEEHTSELQSRLHLVCRLLLEKKKQSPHGQRRPYPSARRPCHRARLNARTHPLRHHHGRT